MTMNSKILQYDYNIVQLLRPELTARLEALHADNSDNYSSVDLAHMRDEADQKEQKIHGIANTYIDKIRKCSSGRYIKVNNRHGVDVDMINFIFEAAETGVRLYAPDLNGRAFVFEVDDTNNQESPF